ncbi:type II secretion system F family protein [Tessaracoccus rhinocerotis]|uniref:type II secretion system F family protein n=1 Tax=Tessaracoccus rhinocerotis TaxID=1689449 RepID=UPI00163D58A5|nr:type II secretion system F family protein [Tessaracoccus rhinocerotis]
MTALVQGLPGALLVALAVAVGIGPPAGSRLGRLRARVDARRGRARLFPLLVLVGLAVLPIAFGWRVLGWVVAAGIVVALVAWLVRRQVLERRRRVARDAAADAAHTLALLLRAGQIPTAALAEAAADHPCLAPAAATVRLGGDVAEALLESAREPGGEALAQLAGAWRVGEASGAPVAKVVAQVTETVRREQQLADVVATELSAARTSGRIMATLPLLAIALGMAAGADPVTFLFRESAGQLLLVAGVALAASGVVWTERIAATPDGRRGRS